MVQFTIWLYVYALVYVATRTIPICTIPMKKGFGKLNRFQHWLVIQGKDKGRTVDLL